MHIAKRQKPVWKGHVVCGSGYVIFWKRQNRGDDIEDQRLAGVCGEGGMSRRSAGDAQGTEPVLMMPSLWTCVMHLPKAIGYSIRKVNPEVDHGL